MTTIPYEVQWNESVIPCITYINHRESEISPKLLPVLCLKLVSTARFQKLHAVSLCLQDQFFANRFCGKCQVKSLCGIEMKLCGASKNLIRPQGHHKEMGKVLSFNTTF